MSYPILYNASVTSFKNQLSGMGIGVLSDALEVIVTEELNGGFELEMTYPADGKYASRLANDLIIYAEPSKGQSWQAFDIYSIEKNIDGKITVYAAHISYRLNLVPVSPFSATSISEALTKLKANMVDTGGVGPFSFSTDKSTSASFTMDVPKPCKTCLQGEEGSILDTFRGEFTWDNFVVYFNNHRGSTAKGITVRYGKNITDITQEESIEETYTGIYPYYVGYNSETEEDVYVELPEKVLHASTYDNYAHAKTIPVDLSEKFEEIPTVAELRAAAQTYISENSIGKPNVNLDVTHIDLFDAEISGHSNQFLVLGDTVTIIFEKLNIEKTSRIVKIEYNVLKERNESMEIGEVSASLAKTIASTQNQVTAMRNTINTDVQNSIARATSAITGKYSGAGHVQLHDDGSGDPYEITIADSKNINQAKKIWRWNLGGLGYSSTGYNGTFGTAITMDGEIVANYVTAGTLNANVIRAGLLSDTKGYNYWNLETGAFSLAATSTVGGNLIASQNYATSAASTAVSNYDSSLNQAKVFNKLTNNGQTQGIYLTNNRLYINASYIGTGTLSANYIYGGTLKVGGANDANGVIEVYDGQNRLINYINYYGIYHRGWENGVSKWRSRIGSPNDATFFMWDDTTDYEYRSQAKFDNASLYMLNDQGDFTYRGMTLHAQDGYIRWVNTRHGTTANFDLADGKFEYTDRHGRYSYLNFSSGWMNLHNANYSLDIRPNYINTYNISYNETMRITSQGLYFHVDNGSGGIDDWLMGGVTVNIGAQAYLWGTGYWNDEYGEGGEFPIDLGWKMSYNMDNRSGFLFYNRNGSIVFEVAKSIMCQHPGTGNYMVGLTGTRGSYEYVNGIAIATTSELNRMKNNGYY